jgi:diguanylate cyclase (GGDEF)-like protein
MTEQITKSVIEACLEIERRAATLYGRIASAMDDELLCRFWEEMKGQEEEHISYWEGLGALADRQRLPQIVEEPAETLDELERIPPKVDALWEHFLSDRSETSAFLLSYRMEFFLLHPVFAMFFHLMESPIEGVNPADDYDRHLHKFADELSRHGDDSPELDLLGETLQEMWRRNSELARQSAHDALTGILNRRGFFAALKPLSHLSQRNDRMVAVMLADVDDFKEVNDRLGHHAGDDVLRLVATTMRASVRASDLVGRYGGEEFIVFLSAVEEGAARTIAEDMRKSVETVTAGGGPAVTVSIGVAEARLPQDVDEGLDGLIRRADASVYRAKSDGKNRVVADMPSQSVAT